jgi:hypothetical protein
MFQLTTPTEVKLASFSVRTEKHGDDDVLAFSAGLKYVGPNTFLDALAPGLRESLYSAVEGQEQLPGVEPSTPLLRCKKIEQIALDLCFEGWTLEVEHGIDEPMKIGGVKVDKFKVTPYEGGSCEVAWRIGSNDVDETELGQLAGKLTQMIMVRLLAPEKPAEAIDGSVEAFQRDHPEADPTDLFIAGGDGPEDEETEGGDPDCDGPVLAADEPAKARRRRGAVLQ